MGRWAWDAFSTDPDTPRQAVASFERVTSTRQPDMMMLLRFDIPRQEMGGGGFQERYWSITHIPILDTQGHVGSVLQHRVDVTELQHLHHAVRKIEGTGEFDPHPAHTGIFDWAPRPGFEAYLHTGAGFGACRHLGPCRARVRRECCPVAVNQVPGMTQADSRRKLILSGRFRIP